MEGWNRNICDAYHSHGGHDTWAFPSVVRYWWSLDFTVVHRDTATALVVDGGLTCMVKPF